MSPVMLYVRAVTAAGALAVLAFGVPLALTIMFGNPLPDLDALQVADLSTDVLLHVAASVTWCLWAYFILLIAVETRSQVAAQPSPALPGLAGRRNLVQPLVAALLLSAPSITATAAAASLPPHPLPPHPGTGAGSARVSSSALLSPGSTAGPVQRITSAPVATWTSVGTPAYADHAPDPATAPSATSTDSGQQFVLGMGSGVGLSLVAATFYTVIHRRRRDQRVARRPGRLPATIEPEAAAVERNLRAGHDMAQAVRQHLATALNDLNTALAQRGAAAAQVLAARVDHDRIDLVLNDPTHQPPPSPWQQDPQTGVWSLTGHSWADAKTTDTETLTDAGNVAESSTLPVHDDVTRWVWIGSGTTLFAGGAAGQHRDDVWLLNLGVTPVVRVIGPVGAATDLVRAMTLSLNHQDTSQHVRVDSAADELKELATRGSLVHTRTHARGPASPPAPLDVPRSRTPNTENVIQVRDDIRPTGSVSRPTSGPAETLLILTDDLASVRADEVRLVVDATGQLHTSFTGLPMLAARVSNEQIDLLRPSLAAAQTPADRQPPRWVRPSSLPDGQDEAPVDILGMPIPAETTPRQPHTRRQQGPRNRQSLRVDDHTDIRPGRRAEEHALTESPAVDAKQARLISNKANPQVAGTEDSSGISVLDDHPRAQITAATGVALEDVRAVAPALTPTQQAKLSNDPTLDADLQAWHGDHCARPRLRLLGPVEVRANGVLPPRGQRIPWWTEIVVLLSAHPEGLDYDQLAELLWPDDALAKAAGNQPRQAISAVRRWLGTDPDTGNPYLPEGRPGTSQRTVHRIEGLLCDADLARRLRTRGISRGPDGMQDLQAALDLVTGRILDQRRRSGYDWLTVVPILTDLTSLITDIAHTLATQWITARQPHRAEKASRTAALAGSDDDITHLDLIAAAEALGHRSDADWWLQHLIAAHDGEVEEDLPPVTLARLDHIRRRRPPA